MDGGGKKMCVFQGKTGRVSEMVRDRAKVTINHRKWHTPFQMKWKSWILD